MSCESLDIVRVVSPGWTGRWRIGSHVEEHSEEPQGAHPVLPACGFGDGTCADMVEFCEIEAGSVEDGGEEDDGEADDEADDGVDRRRGLWSGRVHAEASLGEASVGDGGKG